MKMKPGYKQTEVGVIPEDWSKASLTSLIERGSRVTYGVVQPGKNDADGVLFVRGGDVFEGRVNEGQLRRIPKAVSDKYQRTRLSGGEILISLVGYPGEAALVPQSLAGANIARQVALVRLNKDLPINREFVCKFLQSDAGRRQLLKEAIGSAQQVINLRDIKNVALALPPTNEEQRAIAAALSDVDALLGGLDRLLAQKRDLKQAAMQQLLTGQTRLPGFSGAWEVKPLTEIVSTPITDGPHLTPTFLNDGIPFLSVNNLVNNKLDLSSLRFVSRSDHEEFSKKCRPRRGDILFGKAASVGQVALLDTDLELNIWSPLALIRVGHKASAQFVVYALQTRDVHRQIALLTNASSQGNIGMSDIGRIAIPVPSLVEQAAISAVLSDMDAELAALEARRDKTRDLKQAMMQELLTGKTRLL